MWKTGERGHPRIGETNNLSEAVLIFSPRPQLNSRTHTGREEEEVCVCVCVDSPEQGGGEVVGGGGGGDSRP